MKVSYHKIPSVNLAQDFELKIFGDKGKPVIVFPSSCGRFFDYENFGMIETLKPYIEAQDIFVICVDGRDWDSWYATVKTPQMGSAHRKYELCIAEDVRDFLKNEYGVQERFLCTGVSGGAYHALNFGLKFPEVFDISIAQSGVYTLNHFVGSYWDLNIYYNDILSYLPNLTDDKILSSLRKNYFIICHGRGPWEECNHEAAAIARLLSAKGITCWYDVWDERYPHDWPSWKEQIIKFMNALKSGVMFPNSTNDKVKFIGPERKKNAFI